MENTEAYQQILDWATRAHLKNALPVDGANERAYQLASFIAEVRLKNRPLPLEPNSAAVEILVKDIEAAKFEAMIMQAMQFQIAAAENQPYFGCHRTADTKPPHKTS